jgi:hypothetical protein
MSFSRFVVDKLAVTAEVSAIAGGHDDLFTILCLPMHAFIIVTSIQQPAFMVLLLVLLCLYPPYGIHGILQR